ncbi:MAG: carbohydrate ABC transporter permease [Clostridia bacterium]|nr:carbohydrate ABC transporter permease [Clostridia bacterium]
MEIKKIKSLNREKIAEWTEPNNVKHIKKVVTYKATRWVWALFRTALLIGLGFIIIYPLLSMLSYSFNGDFMGNSTFVWIPQRFTMENMQLAWKFLEYPESVKNTLFIAVGSSILQIISCSLAGYGFARFDFKGKNILFLLVVLSIIVPPQTYIISTYLDYKFFSFFGIGNIGKLFGGKAWTVPLTNTYFSFWVPSMFAQGLRGGLYIFIFKQFFAGMPKELENAAKIDGCNALNTFIKIMLPNAGSACLTVFLFSFVWHWNDYYVSNMMFQTKNEPLSVVIFRQSDFMRMMTGYSGEVNYQFILNAAVLLSTIPLLILYAVAQKYFIESVAKVGVKG